MTDINITLSAEEAHQTLRALAGRKRTFRKTADVPVLEAIQRAQNKVIKAINAAEIAPALPLDTDTPPQVASTPAPRKRRTAKKED